MGSDSLKCVGFVLRDDEDVLELVAMLHNFKFAVFRTIKTKVWITHFQMVKMVNYTLCEFNLNERKASYSHEKMLQEWEWNKDILRGKLREYVISPLVLR